MPYTAQGKIGVKHILIFVGFIVLVWIGFFIYWHGPTIIETMKHPRQEFIDSLPKESPLPLSTIKWQLCLYKSDLFDRVYKCDYNIYESISGMPGQGTEYFDSQGNSIALCGGSNLYYKAPWKCIYLSRLDCDDNTNLCAEEK